LSGADLRGADLRWTDLTGATLSVTNLCRANLREASLTWARYNLHSVLQVEMGILPDDLTLELMRWDATVCGEEAMTSWAYHDMECPFSGTNIERLFIFREQAALWKPGPPEMNIMQLWEDVAEKLNIMI
jgi:hypothetical protein